MLVHEFAGLGSLGTKIGPPAMPPNLRNRGCKRIELPPSTIVSKGVPPEITAASTAAYEKFRKTNDKVQYEKDLAPVRKASLAWSESQARMWREDEANRRKQMEAEVARLKAAGWTEEVIKTSQPGKGGTRWSRTTRYICPPAGVASPATSTPPSSITVIPETPASAQRSDWGKLREMLSQQNVFISPIERPQPPTTPLLPGLVKAATDGSSAAQEGGGSTSGQGPGWTTYALVGGGVVAVGVALYFAFR